MRPILLLLLCLCSCSPSSDRLQKDAEAKAIEFLKEHLNDWASYELIKFDALSSDSTTYEDIKAQKEAEITKMWAGIVIDSVEKEMNFLKTGVAPKYNYSDKHKAMDSAKTANKHLEENFTPSFKGYRLRHTFRANNAFGGKIVGEYIYVFDKDLKLIDVIQ